MSEAQQSPFDDTLIFKLHTSRTEVQQNVQVNVPVTMLVQPSMNNPAVVDTQIRDALQHFIPTDWVFSTIQRAGETLGYERLHLLATARVPHSEVYNLKERARNAGREGLELGEPKVNYKLPSAKVSEVNDSMRLQLLEDVMKHIPAIDKATGRRWRIGQIHFGARKSGEDEVPRYSKGGYREESNEDLNADVGLKGGERFSLLAEVTLRSKRA